MKPAKPRKPKGIGFARLGFLGPPNLIILEHGAIGLKSAKRLHAWLGRAIAYLESKGKRNGEA